MSSSPALGELRTLPGRVGPGEQVAQACPAQRHPDPPAVFRPTVQQMIPLAQRPDVAVNRTQWLICGQSIG